MDMTTNKITYQVIPKKKSSMNNCYQKNSSFESKSHFLRDKYMYHIDESEEIKKLLILELTQEKKLINKEINKLKIDTEFLEQNKKNYKESIDSLLGQIEYVSEKLLVKENSLSQLGSEVVEQQVKVDDIQDRIDRLYRIILIDEKRLTGDSTYSKGMAGLIGVISKRKVKVEELKVLLITEEKSLQFLQSRLRIEQEYSEKEKNLLQETKMKLLNLIEMYEKKLKEIDLSGNEITSLKKQYFQGIADLDRELDMLIGDSPKFQANTISIADSYLLMTDDLPKKLDVEESSSMRIWNTFMKEKNNMMIGTTKLNINLADIVADYKLKGWLKSQIKVHNLYTDILSLDKESLQNSYFDLAERNSLLLDFFVEEKNSISYYYDEVENIALENYKDEENLDYYIFTDGMSKHIEVYGIDRLIVEIEMEGNQIVQQQYYNHLGEKILIFYYKEEKVEQIVYGDVIFKSEQEFLVYWLMNFIEFQSILNIIVDQNSFLFSYSEELSAKGINLIPLIHDMTDRNYIRNLLGEHCFDEIFLIDEENFEEIEQMLPSTANIHLLRLEEEKTNSNDKITVLIDD